MDIKNDLSTLKWLINILKLKLAYKGEKDFKRRFCHSLFLANFHGYISFILTA